MNILLAIVASVIATVVSDAQEYVQVLNEPTRQQLRRQSIET